MKPLNFSRTLALLLFVAGASTLTAQTAAKPAAPATTVHKPATASAASTTVHKVAATPTVLTGGCVTDLPTLSAKIPALPAGSVCPKPLFTISHKPDFTLDYVSPLVGEQTRKALTFTATVVSLDYVDTVVGTGELLKPDQYLSVHYTGYLPDGTKFDSSLDRGEPITFPYGQHRVIQGWDTGFEGMHVGGKRRLFIPYQLAYGEQGKAPIPPRSWLVFDVELVAQSSTPPEPKTVPAPAAKPATPPPATPPPASKPAKEDSDEN